ncbi:MAG: NTP transferase domain-containing protein [Actinomycetota bacterium]|nr:NTP transferase domain-containing protein [Actinomycetota bacterium]
MAVVVLAAGHGRRLGAAGGPGPKWLIEVGGAPIADRHLTAVEQTLGPDTDVLVVVGHAADRVERYLEARAARSALRPRPVLNDKHAERNNWYSLLVGLDALDGRLGEDDVVVVLNSDLFGLPGWIGALLGAAAEVRDVPGFLAVDVVRPLTAEAMKVAAGASDALGRRWCTAIGKVGVKDPIGEYVGMSALAPSGRALVHDALRAFAADGDRADAWYEEAFQEVNAGSPFLVSRATPSSAWVEIDDADDLRAADRLAAVPLTGQATTNAPALPPSVRPTPRSRGS